MLIPAVSKRPCWSGWRCLCARGHLTCTGPGPAPPWAQHTTDAGSSPDSSGILSRPGDTKIPGRNAGERSTSAPGEPRHQGNDMHMWVYQGGPGPWRDLGGPEAGRRWPAWERNVLHGNVADFSSTGHMISHQKEQQAGLLLSGAGRRPLRTPGLGSTGTHRGARPHFLMMP